MEKKRIVVIDDDNFTLTVVKDILEDAGFEVFTAQSGIGARQYIFGEPKPDLILIDVLMPILTGDKITALLKEGKVSREIPVILMSTTGQDELERLARSSGADGFIAKPLERDVLLSALERYLKSPREN